MLILFLSFCQWMTRSLSLSRQWMEPFTFRLSTKNSTSASKLDLIYLSQLPWAGVKINSIRFKYAFATSAAYTSQKACGLWADRLSCPSVIFLQSLQRSSGNPATTFTQVKRQVDLLHLTGGEKTGRLINLLP
jgi:hypothetical protein